MKGTKDSATTSGIDRAAASRARRRPTASADGGWAFGRGATARQEPSTSRQDVRREKDSPYYGDPVAMVAARGGVSGTRASQRRQEKPPDTAGG
nr:hypothetical protein GCM10020241_03580 [Streptoalloteichus tenebrarius]